MGWATSLWLVHFPCLQPTLRVFGREHKARNIILNVNQTTRQSVVLRDSCLLSCGCGLTLQCCFSFTVVHQRLRVTRCTTLRRISNPLEHPPTIEHQ